MRIVEYTPDRFESLRRAAEQMSPTVTLRHRPFVDYYFATRDWCKLYLFLSDDESVAATLGYERMRFEYEGRELIIGIGSSFWSLQKGAGGFLFMQQLKDCPIGMTINGTAYTQQIMKNLKWSYFEGIHDFHLNAPDSEERPSGSGTGSSGWCGWRWTLMGIGSGSTGCGAKVWRASP